jgi:hypothetical protein
MMKNKPQLSLEFKIIIIMVNQKILKELFNPLIFRLVKNIDSKRIETYAKKKLD